MNLNSMFILLLLFMLCFCKDHQLSNLKTLLEQQGNLMRKDKNLQNILSSWIQQKSLSGNESGVQQLIQKELLNLGMETTLYELNIEDLKQNKYFVSNRKDFKGSPNLIGILRGKYSKGTDSIVIDSQGNQNQQQQHRRHLGRSVILNGHVDVVHEGDNQWKLDPYSGHNDGQRIYGRGSTDMKGGIFSSFLALKMLQNLDIELDGDVIFQSVIEEESGGAGTLSTVLKGFHADAAIIPEPTQLKIFPKQQGSMWFRIHVFGLSAHGGTRYEGVSAIEKSMLVINAIKKLEDERNQRVKSTDPLYKDLPIPIPINVGKIHGGKWPSSVADLVILEGRIGVSPSETLENAREELHKALVNIEDEWIRQHPVKLEFFGAHWLPGGIDLNHDIVKKISEAYEEVLNGKPVIESSPWGTDGGYLSYNGIPAVVFGPGTTSLAHQVDESIDIDNMISCAKVIALTLVNFCNNRVAG